MMALKQINETKRVAAIAVAASLLCSAAYADRYLPPSRYESGNLPSPTMLYPERDAPLYPENYNTLYPESLSLSETQRTAPTPPPVAISPEPAALYEPPAMMIGEPLTPAPAAQPTDAMAAQPFTQAPTYAPLAVPMTLPSSSLQLPPPPPVAADAPKFVPLATLETTAPNAMPLQRQPILSAPEYIPPQATAAAPIATAKPTVAAKAPEPIEAPEIVEAPKPVEAPLDAQTQSILSSIPGGIDRPRGSGGKTSLDRFDPDIQGVLKPPVETIDDVLRHESIGVAIEIRQPNLDVDHELQSAYDALMGGQPQIAMQIYKDILREMPRHQDALFGVATTYHRMGEPALAKPYYIKLLKLNPKHRDGLTNFLSLVATEAPERATAKLEYLAKQNPDFSAIPALLGGLYEKMGKPDIAEESLIRAVRMEPDNVAYKYNLAVLYDTHGKIDQATVLYNQLLNAGRSGIPLPATMRDLQERVININQTSREG